jgi:hypothetical protein
MAPRIGPNSRSVRSHELDRRRVGLLSKSLGPVPSWLTRRFAEIDLRRATGSATSLGLFILFWLVASHFYTVKQIGLNATLIVIPPVLGYAARMNLGQVLQRTLPTAGDAAPNVLAAIYGVASLGAVVMSTALVFNIGELVAQFDFLEDVPRLTLLFAGAVVAETLFALSEIALACSGKAALAPLQNWVRGVVAIGLLVPMASAPVFELGPFAAWTVSTIAVVVIFSGLVFFQSMPALRLGSTATTAVSVRLLIPALDWNRIGTLFIMMAGIAGPLLVLKYSGRTEAASYSIAWIIAAPIFLSSRMIANRVLDGLPAGSGRLPARTIESLLSGGMIQLLTVALLIVAAPYVMALFHLDQNVDGTALLRMLLLASLPWAVVVFHVEAMRRQERRAAAVCSGAALLVAALAAGIPLTKAFGGWGMASAWLAVQSAAALSICGLIMARLGRDGIIDLALVAGSAVARGVAAMPHFGHHSRTAADPDRNMAGLLAATGVAGAKNWRALHTVPTLSDVSTVFLGNPRQGPAGQPLPFRPDRASALLKTPFTPDGAAALERYMSRLAQVRSDPRLSNWDVQLPEILAAEDRGDGIRLIERVVRGDEGRDVLSRPEARASAMPAALRVAAELHRLTACHAVIDEDWIGRWIAAPVNALRRPVLTLMTEQQRQAALTRLFEEQWRFWRDREVPLGWSHGDLSPGNILFRVRRQNPGQNAGAPRRPAGTRFEVEGLIDWDMAQPDSPSAFDAFHLLLTTRSLVTGDGLGRIVRDMLVNPRFQDDELQWLASSTESDRDLMTWFTDPYLARHMCGLVWLQHVNGNMLKSASFVGRRLWASSNVERVLDVFLRER